MARIITMVSVAALALLLLCLLRLGTQQRSGPLHTDLVLDGGTPATLYLPRDGGEAFRPDPPPREERPAAVVLMHGFASDRFNMSPLARSLASAGYAVLAVDVAGHGENRTGRFEQGRSQRGPFFEELAAAVHYLRRSPHVDGEHLMMMGHSMGASASLAYASLDPTIDGAVMIAGGRSTPGPHRPANALFLYAEADPERTRTRASEVARRLAGDPDLEAQTTVGDFSFGTAVRFEEVPGVDHVSILISDDATRRIVAWLDQITGIERAAPAGMKDPRLGTATVALVALVFLLPGVGLALGGRAAGAGGSSSPAEERAPDVAGLGVLLVALVAALPLIGSGSPLPALSLEIGDRVIPYLGAAGVATLLVLGSLGRFDAAILFRGAGVACCWALFAVLGVMLLLAPLGVVFHRLTLTPERLAIALASAVLLFPLTLAIEAGLRGSGSGLGSALSLAARFGVVAALAAGIAGGVLPSVVGLMLPILAVFLLLLELPAAFVRFAGSGTAVAAAVFQAAMLAWILAAVLPVRV